MKTGFALVMLAALAAAPFAQEQEPPQVAGRWNMTVKGPAAHGDMSATLALSQKGRTVSGTLAAHGNEHTLAGEFVDGTLTLDATDMPHDNALSLTGRLQDDGSLKGYLSGPMGDMQWTATRAAGRP